MPPPPNADQLSQACPSQRTVTLAACSNQQRHSKHGTQIHQLYITSIWDLSPPSTHAMYIIKLLAPY